MAYKIGDFSFDTQEEAMEAQKEAQAIAYIMKQIDMDQPQMALEAYRQMIQQDLFHTKLGIAFLADMRRQLVELPQMQGQEIPQVPGVKEPDSEAKNRASAATSVQDQTPEENLASADDAAPQKDIIYYRRMAHVLLVACVTMLAIIIGMFIINQTSNHPTILNYEEKIIDKYAQWEEQLDQREQELNERERQLNQ